MNFTPYGTPFTSVGSIPTGHQFTTAKLAHQVGTGGNQVLGLISADEAGVTYLRPVDLNGALTVNLPTNSGNNTTHNQIITLPISLPGAKPGDVQQQTLQIVVNPGTGGGLAPGEKYAVPLTLQHFQQGVLTVAYSNAQQGGESIQLQVHQAEAENGTVDHHTQTQQEQNSQHSSGGTNSNNNNNNNDDNGGPQSVQIQHAMQTEEMVLPDVKPILTEAVATSDQGGTPQAYPVAVVAQLPSDLILRNEDLEQAEKNAGKDGKDRTREIISISGENYNAIQASWQSLAAPGSTVADYLSRIPASTLPLSLHHFLKFSAETIKRESAIESSPLSNADGTEATQTSEMQTTTTADGENPDEVDPQNGKAKKKKKYKKKAPKPRRPRPGQVHIATALDGTTLFCCPECNMAYSAKDLLEQHLVSHKIERRFICDICGAGLKRKEHLERHKLGHNPERPYICSVCCKGFKRKEHLNLHFVIHSGEKTEVCPECGKGFYRKDHLRKHARSHIAKRVKEEFSQQQQQAQQQHQQAQQQQAAQQQQQVAQQQQQQQHATADQGQQPDGSEPQDNGTTTTTVVMPTVTETGAMTLLHHQHHHGERIGHHVIALENFNVEETACEENT